MKPAALLLMVLLASSISIEAQTRKYNYRIRVELFTGEKLSGYLIALNPHSIHVWISEITRKDTVLLIETIRTVSLRREKASRKGMLIGLGLGSALGAAIGYASYSPPDCDNAFICVDLGADTSAIGGAFLGGVVGSLAGLIVGLGYEKHTLNGNLATYEKFCMKIKGRFVPIN